MKSKTLVLIGIALVVIAGCSGNQITNPVNQPPLITAMAVTPEQAHLGDLVTVSSSAHDPESQNVTFNWTATFGYFIGSGPTVTFNTIYCCVVGVNEITLTVTDPQGNSTERKIWVSIE
ncbi:MAG: hypothetical protein A2Z27_05625 [candidate division Zixibacteria bacterium RBG_16_50_21]|nr:MAG: hypothetical protein A2Z27_05625 [candidate division Zixibacteria bacterium RBG_16_50_21]